MENQTAGKGFSPNQDQSKNQYSTSQASSAAEQQAAIEVSLIRESVNDSIQGIRSGFNDLVQEYEEITDEFVRDASYQLYDMLSGSSVFRAIGQNVGHLMQTHPTRGQVALGKHQPLKKLSFKPLTRETSSRSCLNAVKGEE